MHDSTIKKVSEKTAPKGAMGQTYLVSGKHLAMRLWRNEAPQADEPPSRRDYETVGYVIAGRAELNLEGQTIHLAPGDSWLVPAHAEHRYRIIEPFTAVEATAPPAQVHGRDEIRSR
jgi:quercetin dioxygenase-like cupin family protein